MMLMLLMVMVILLLVLVPVRRDSFGLDSEFRSQIRCEIRRRGVWRWKMDFEDRETCVVEFVIVSVAWSLLLFSMTGLRGR